MKMSDKVCIGMVNNGWVQSQLMVDIIHIALMKKSHFDSVVQVANIGLTTRSRNVVVREFLDNTEAEWLLLVDSDESLKPEVFQLLCDTAHDKERPIVSGLVFGAFFDNDGQLRPVPTIYDMDPEDGLQPIDNFPINELIEVDAVGTGCLLIHRSVLLTIQAHATQNQGPRWAWFAEGAIEGTYFGEDLLFSKRLQSLGYKIHVHTGATLPHRKEFWLDHRHHAGWLQTFNPNAGSEVPLASEPASNSEE